MADPTFQIVFRGKILAGFERSQVRDNLARLFRSDPTRIDALLDAPKTVLKGGLARDAAGRYQEMLRQAGIMVAVIGESPQQAPEAAAPTAPPAPITSTESTPAPVEAPPVPQAPSGLTLAEAGAVLVPPPSRQQASFDTSGMSLAEVGVVLVERRPPPIPDFDLSAFGLAPPGDPIDNTPRPAPLAVDTSSLSLSEQPPESEEEPTELQRLLSSE